MKIRANETEGVDEMCTDMICESVKECAHSY